MRYINMSEFLMDRIKFEDLSEQMQTNAKTIVVRANQLLKKFGEYRKVNSGYRSFEDQLKINPKALGSKHLYCQAIDLEDQSNSLKAFCTENLPILESIGLWMEDPKSTPTWVHIQVVPPKSGKRVFIP